MSAHEDVENGDRDGWFVAAAGMVGDLGNPFYREERQRDVWNEASAVGLQLVLWLGLGAVAAMVWLGGAPALPYAVAAFVVLGAASGVSLLYAHKLGVRIDDAGRVLRLRLVPYCVLLLLFLVGAVRAAPSGGFGAGFARGQRRAVRSQCCGWCGAGPISAPGAARRGVRWDLLRRPGEPAALR